VMKAEFTASLHHIRMILQKLL